MRFAVVLFLGWLVASPALGFTSSRNEVADAFLRAHVGSGSEDVTVGSLEVDGATVRLTGVEITAPTAVKRYERVEIMGGRVEDGVLLAERITFGPQRTSFEDPTEGGPSTEVITIEADEWTGVRLPEATLSENADPVAALLVAERIVSTDVAFRVPGAFDLSVASSTLTASERELDAAIGLTVEMDGMRLSLPQDVPAVEENVFSASSTFRWEAPTGRLEIASLNLAADRFGSVGLSGSVAGLTSEFFAALEAIGKATPPVVTELDRAIAGLTVEDARLALNDEGMVDALLSLAGTGMGLDATSAAHLAVGSLQGALLAVGDEAFAARAAAAARAFLLGEAARLTVRLTPPEPITLETIGTTARMAPQTLEQVLGLEVTAGGGPASTPAPGGEGAGGTPR
ncbi:hypothetical protein [Acuticoccus sp.]|uniref:hypothetical protein n=1 Tax=Acuticoccus sp. TaxID=1904378 RepID=UPI003B516172